MGGGGKQSMEVKYEMSQNGAEMFDGVVWKGLIEMCLLRTNLKEVKELIPGLRDFQASISEQLIQMPTCSGYAWF